MPFAEATIRFQALEHATLEPARLIVTYTVPERPGTIGMFDPELRPESLVLTEIVTDQKGRPRWFRASVLELEQAFAAIRGELLVDAYEHEWTSRGLEPPPLTVSELRARVLMAHQLQASRMPRERLLSLTDAAPHLGMSERQLRHRVDQGEYDDDLTMTRDGKRALRFRPQPTNWALVPGHLRPDPREALLG